MNAYRPVQHLRQDKAFGKKLFSTARPVFMPKSCSRLSEKHLSASVAAEPGRRSGRGATSVATHLENDAKRRTPAATAPPAPLERVKYTILVVDDVHAARYAAARVLRAAGFNTLEAGSGAKALQLAPSASAVLLDVHLPDIHGFEVCRLLRSVPATAALPVVHVSAIYVSAEDQLSGKTVGADVYLVAPVDSETLVSTIDKLLGIVEVPRDQSA